MPKKQNIIIKIGAITLITLVLLLPTSMINQLIQERELTQQEAIREVNTNWGESQTIAGPIITIPYTVETKQIVGKAEDEEYTNSKTRNYYHILPDELSIESKVEPEKLNRGIYDIVVYGSDTKLSGKFGKLELASDDLREDQIHYDEAFISIGIDDLRGIQEEVVLNWGAQELVSNPGTKTFDLFPSGINVPLDLSEERDANQEFSVTLNLNGSENLSFAPVGKTTTLNMSSPWKDPSFNGEFLPDDRKVTDDGFTAEWKVLNLNRKYPQSWSGKKHNVLTSSFGVNLLIPVDGYQKSTRSIKYAILFIALTFLSFFFVEILMERSIHPIQYVLVGLALVLFYTLLLSMSEYLPYNTAFWISAGATILLITAYVRSILRSYALAGMIAVILGILYTFIFVIIQMQDFSLLIGSVGLFLILACVMYFSRRIDWDEIAFNTQKSNAPNPAITIDSNS